MLFEDDKTFHACESSLEDLAIRKARKRLQSQETE